MPSKASYKTGLLLIKVSVLIAAGCVMAAGAGIEHLSGLLQHRTGSQTQQQLALRPTLLQLASETGSSSRDVKASSSRPGRGLLDSSPSLCPDDGWLSYVYSGQGTRSGCCKAQGVGTCPSPSCAGENGLANLGGKPLTCGGTGDVVTVDSSAGTITCTQASTQLTLSCKLHSPSTCSATSASYCLGSISRTNSAAADVAYYDKPCITLNLGSGRPAFRVCSGPATPPAVTMSCPSSRTPGFTVSWSAGAGQVVQAVQVSAVDTGAVCDVLQGADQLAGQSYKTYMGKCGSTVLPSNGGFLVTAQLFYTFSPTSALSDDATSGDRGQFLVWAQQIACQANPDAPSGPAPAAPASPPPGTPLPVPRPLPQARAPPSPAPPPATTILSRDPASGNTTKAPPPRAPPSQLAPNTTAASPAPPAPLPPPPPVPVVPPVVPSAPVADNSACPAAIASVTGAALVSAAKSSSSEGVAKAMLLAVAQGCALSPALGTSLSQAFAAVTGEGVTTVTSGVAQAYAQEQALTQQMLALAFAASQTQSTAAAAAAAVVSAIGAGGVQAQAFAAGLAQGITQLGLSAVGQVVAYAQSAAANQGDALLLAQALASARVVAPSSSSSPFAAAATPSGVSAASQAATVPAPGSTQQARRKNLTPRRNLS